MRVDIFIDEYHEARMITAGAAHGAERGAHGVARERLFDGENQYSAAESDAFDSRDAQRL